MYLGLRTYCNLSHRLYLEVRSLAKCKELRKFDLLIMGTKVSLELLD